MKYLKYAALLFVLALSMTIGVGAAAAENPPVPPQQDSSTSISSILNAQFGQVIVRGTPGAFYSIRGIDGQGNSVTLANGGVNASGVGQSMFPIPPGLLFSSLTAMVMTNGSPVLYFSYDSELDRWILD